MTKNSENPQSAQDDDSVPPETEAQRNETRTSLTEEQKRDYRRRYGSAPYPPF